jgi:hypothetical protein
VEWFQVESAGLDKLEKARLVLGTIRLEGNGSQMFSGEHAGGNTGDVSFNRVNQGFFEEWIGGRKELDGPSARTMFSPSIFPPRFFK